MGGLKPMENWHYAIPRDSLYTTASRQKAGIPNEYDSDIGDHVAAIEKGTVNEEGGREALKQEWKERREILGVKVNEVAGKQGRSSEGIIDLKVDEVTREMGRSLGVIRGRRNSPAKRRHKGIASSRLNRRERF